MEEACQGGSPTPTGSRTPPVLVGVGEKEREGEGEAKGGCTPCPIRTRGGVPPSFWPLSSIPVWPNKAHILPGEFPQLSGTPKKIPESLGTFPMSEYSRPIYRSLRFGHFETPRHVSDLIWDSELSSVHQNS